MAGTKLMAKAAVNIVERFTKGTAMAVKLALAEQRKYEDKIKARNEDIFAHSKKTGNITVLLAGRPYHTDPLVQHKLSNLISAMGINVISEDIVRNDDNLSTNESFLVEQWAYINRILKAAQWVANQASDVHFMSHKFFLFHTGHAHINI